MHPLDNIIWNALTTRQSEFAESFGQARRFMPEVTALGAFREPTAESYESLAGLVGTRRTVALFLDDPYEKRAGWERIAGAPLLQMVCENGDAQPTSQHDSDPELVELCAADSPQMIELTNSAHQARPIRQTHS
jgi:hypothetical protein